VLVGVIVPQLDGRSDIRDTDLMKDIAKRRKTRTKRRKKRKARPACAAILLCDLVIRDEETQKSSIIGMFDTFVLRQIPGETEVCAVFLRLTNVIGHQAISAEIHDSAAGLVLFRSSPARIRGHERRGAGEIALRLSPLRFDRAGTYDMVVLAEGEEIGRAEFKIALGA
jgi:hypothetical protein